MNVRRGWIVWLVWVCGASLQAGEGASFVQAPTVTKSGGGATVSFALAAKSDVEVAVLNAKGDPIRHLAAGLLGGAGAPPPPLKEGLAQQLAWDGKDDFGKAAAGGPFKIRVRAGMKAKLGRFLGEDPYTFGAINAIATDAENKLYVSAFAGETNQNTSVLRRFSAEGAYERTLIPFAANMKPEAVAQAADWDGDQERFIPKNKSSLNPAFYPWGEGSAQIVSADAKAGIVLTVGNSVFRIDAAGGNVRGPFAMWSAAAKLKNPNWNIPQLAVSPDGRYIYYANVAGTQYQPKDFNDTSPDWPQGRVYRQDTSKEGSDPEKFYDLELPPWSKDAYWLPDAWNKRTAAYNVAVDAKGHVYVCDLVNQAVVEVTAEGKKISSTPCPWPERLHIEAKTGNYYVVARTAPPKDGYVAKKLVKVEGRGSAGKIAAEMPLKGSLGVASALGAIGGAPVLWIGGGNDLICVKDAGAAFEAVETKYVARPEAQTDFSRLSVDWARDVAYVNNGTNRIWRYDGMTGEGGLLKENGKVFHATDLSVGYDGLLYIRSGDGYSGPFERRTPDMKPALFETGSHVLTPYVYSRMGVGFSEHGIGVGPDGKSYFSYMYDWNKYCISGFDGNGYALKGKYLKGLVNKPDPKTGKHPMPEGIDSSIVGPLPMSNGGLRVDLQGNIYVGMRLLPEAFAAPEDFVQSNAYKHWTGCAVKFPPDGGTIQGTETKDDQPAEGTPIPAAWAGNKMKIVGALKVYPGVGSFSGSGWGGNGSSCVCRVPRFDVDRFGRLVLPNVVTNSVRIVDNAGNELAEFGKYGNFDSQYTPGGVKDATPAVAVPAIPLGWPTSAGFSKNNVYVCDTYNRRVVRVDFTYDAEQTLDVK